MDGLGVTEEIKGESLEVVDEHMKDKDGSNCIMNDPTEKSLENNVVKYPKCEDQTDPIMVKEQKNIPQVSDDQQLNDINEHIDPSISVCTTNSKIHQFNEDSINFTADITLNELNTQKDITDINVFHCPMETVHISATEQNSNTEEQNVHEQCTEEESAQTSKWYDNKFAGKKAITKERLSKLARVLGYSYPCYEKWLKKMEKIHGSPICKLESVRHHKINKAYPNRWKFICNKQEIRSEDSNDVAEENMQTVWKLKLSDAWGTNINKESKLPSFVWLAVKIFEDFLQITEQSNLHESKEIKEDFSEDISLELSATNQKGIEAKQQWLWLLVRCNSMDELMLFAIGKNITRDTMDRLKYVYESGDGKDCNVKSLYCKSINKCGNISTTTTTFLSGSETLEEVVGEIKLQLAPKTNFWLNAAGAENVANTVASLLTLTPETILLEVGCGVGLIGLMLASKCQQFIGVDLLSEVEEAETTCKLNNIRNASFISGLSAEVISKIMPTLQNRNTRAIINGNTNIGRDIEIMTRLRRIPSLKQIAVITTLTKQSVRAILELARPTEYNNGHPFVPVHASIVDTLPVGSHFEAIILMDRMYVHKNNGPCFPKTINENTEKNERTNTAVPKELNRHDLSTSGKSQLAKTSKSKPMMGMKKFAIKKNFEATSSKEKFKGKGKRAGSPDKSKDSPPKKMAKKFDKFEGKLRRPDTVGKKKKKNWVAENSELRIDALHDADMEEFKDLREKLSNNRMSTDIAKKIKEHQALLEIAKEKLSGPAPTIDIGTAEQLHNMLNMVLEQTNKLQTEVTRSVWNRMLPSENANHSAAQKAPPKSDILPDSRYIQKMGMKNVLITTSNEKFINDKKPVVTHMYNKNSNIPPLEPNQLMPTDYVALTEKEQLFQHKLPGNHCTAELPQEQRNPENAFWNRHRTDQNRHWNETTPPFTSQSLLLERSSKPLVNPPVLPMTLRQMPINRMQTSVYGTRVPSPVRSISSASRQKMLLPNKAGNSQVLDNRLQISSGRIENSPDRTFMVESSWSPQGQRQPSAKLRIPESYSSQNFAKNWNTATNCRTNTQTTSTWKPPSNMYNSTWKNEKPSLLNINCKRIINNEFQSPVSQSTPQNVYPDRPSLNWSTKQTFTQPALEETWSKPKNQSSVSYFQGSTHNNWHAKSSDALINGEESWTDLNKQQNKRFSSRIKNKYWTKG